MSKEYRLSIIVTGKDSGASSMLTGIGGSLRSIGTIAGGILTSQIFLGIANQIGQMFTSAVGVTAQMQTMQMMLTNLQARELIRSGDFDDMNAALRAAAPLAEATMDQLERIATLSPYQLENVANTYKMAMAFGFTAKESTVFTDALLNMAAGVGANGEMLDRMAYNLAQVRMQGKVTAMDIRQLAMAGFDLVDVLKYTGKQMGLNIKDHLDFNAALEQGKISWADFTKYFAEYADKNFGGASERMSRTLEGLKSTFKDVFMLTMPKLLGPLADKVTGYLNDILNSFMKFADSGALEEMGRSLSDFFDSPFFQNGLMGLTRGFEHWAQNINWGKISNDIVDGIQSINWQKIESDVVENFGNIANGISELFNGISIKAAPNITLSLFGDSEIIQEMVSTFDSISAPLSNFVKTLSGEIGVVFLTLGPIISSFWTTVKPSLDLLWVTFKENLPDAFDSFSEILPVLTAVIASSLAILGALITGTVNAIVKSMTILQEVGQLLRTGITNVFGGMEDMMRGFFNFFEGLFTNNSDILRNGFREWTEGVVEIWTGMFQIILGTIGVFVGQAYGLISGFVTGVIGYFQNLYDVLVGHSIIPDLMTSMISIFSSGLLTIVGIFQVGVNGIYQIVWQMVFEIENILVALKQAFIAKFADMIDAAKNLIYERAAEIYQAVAYLIELARSALKPIEIQISTPDFMEIAGRVFQGLTTIVSMGKSAIKPFVLSVIQPAWEWLSTVVAEKADVLYQAGKKALKAISVMVGLPDWEALAREIEEGMAILNAAMKGGVKGGVKGSNSFASKAKAAGGPVQAGETYLVGERGRELFVPDRNGYIVPNHKVEGMGGALMPSHAGAGGSVVVVNFYYQPPISLGNEREARQNIAPMVADVVRGEFQKRGF